MATTIQISEKLQTELNKRKFSERESYEEVIWGMMEDAMELSEETKRHIAQAREDIKAGRVHTHEEVKRKLRL